MLRGLSNLPHLEFASIVVANGASDDDWQRITRVGIWVNYIFFSPSCLAVYSNVCDFWIHYVLKLLWQGYGMRVSKLLVLKGNILSCPFHACASIEMFFGGEGIENAITKKFWPLCNFWHAHFSVVFCFRGGWPQFFCLMAMHLILNSTCFDLAMRGMDNILFYSSEWFGHFFGVFNFNRLLHRLASFGPWMKIYMGETPRLNTDEPIEFMNNRLKSRRISEFKVLVLLGVCQFRLQRHSIVCMRAPNVPCMKINMCILLNELVMSWSFEFELVVAQTWQLWSMCVDIYGA